MESKLLKFAGPGGKEECQERRQRAKKALEREAGSERQEVRAERQTRQGKQPTLGREDRRKRAGAAKEWPSVVVRGSSARSTQREQAPKGATGAGAVRGGLSAIARAQSLVAR